MASLVFKVKTKHGQEVLRNIYSTSTVEFLKHELSKIAKIPPTSLVVLSGFPPKQLDLSDDQKTVDTINVNSGDILIVEEKIQPAQSDLKEENAKAVSESKRHVSENTMDSPGILLKKVVPADNSCLFTSIGFVISGKIDVTCGAYMRQIIAEAVAREPMIYNEAILGRPNKDYCNWIRQPDSWGGAIELAILSEFYGMEIAVVDTINAIINCFGEDKHYPHRVYLLFDGIHYDPLYLESFKGGEKIQTVFPTSDENIFKQAETLALEAQTSRQYTDVNRFTLKCLVCQIQLTGQQQATAHAKETGHMNFGEINKS